MRMLDFEFAAKNDPLFDIAYVVAENEYLWNGTEADIICLLEDYYGDDLPEAQQLKSEVNLIILYSLVLNIKVAVWSRVQVLMENNSVNREKIESDWGPERLTRYFKCKEMPLYQKAIEVLHDKANGRIQAAARTISSFWRERAIVSQSPDVTSTSAASDCASVAKLS